MKQRTMATGNEEPLILLLGCGLCTPPMIQYFNKHKLKLLIATRTTSKADWIVESCEHKDLIKVQALNCEEDGFEDNLRPLVKQASVVISMLPWLLPPKAAKVTRRR